MVDRLAVVVGHDMSELVDLQLLLQIDLVGIVDNIVAGVEYIAVVAEAVGISLESHRTLSWRSNHVPAGLCLPI